MNIQTTQEPQPRLASLKDILNDVFGADQIVIRATKLEVLPLLTSDDMDDQLTALERIIFYDNTYVSQETDFNRRLDLLLQELGELIARKNVEDQLEKIIAEKMTERQDDYYREIKTQVLKEVSGPENALTLKKYAQLEVMESRKLSRSVLELLRPATLPEIVGQDKAVKALLAKMASPFPQHVIVYGPPGVGKTSAARLALEEAKKIASSAFAPDAPFIEVDGTTLRWDPRETTNPLLGSVHDPIYQGARRDLADTGIPEPKPGLVTQANGGVLFIDEIGEMDPMLLGKLLKVLEDKRVEFESSYYDPADEQVPKYIRKIFEEGLPADFVLIGATTRESDELSGALRSRCGEVFFEPLSPRDILGILEASAQKLKIRLEPDAAELISEYTVDGRKATGVLADAYGLLLYEHRGCNAKQLVVTKKTIEEVLQNARMSPKNRDRGRHEGTVGKVFGLGVCGFLGSVLEIEAVAFPAAEAHKGIVRFNDTAGSMAKDSVFNASSVFRLLGEEDLSNRDLHVNVVGGGNIDGPSAGCAIFTALYSAIKEKPVPQDIAITGELSIRGRVRPVGGIAEKIYGAKEAGMKTVILPAENQGDVPTGLKGLRVVPVETAEQLLAAVFGDK